MKIFSKLLLAVLFINTAACDLLQGEKSTDFAEEFIINVSGEYVRGEQTFTVGEDGGFTYVNAAGVEFIYILKQAHTETEGIYEAAGKYYGFIVRGEQLLRTRTATYNADSVQFKNFGTYASRPGSGSGSGGEIDEI